MAKGFKFTDNSAQAKQKLHEASVAGITAALLTIERNVKHYSRYDSGATRDSYSHAVEEDANGSVVGAVGSDMMNGIYEEFGTGEFAEKGNGRKGGWVYFDPVLGEFRHTYGKKPNKPLRRGFQVSKKDISKMIGNSFKIEFGG